MLKFVFDSPSQHLQNAQSICKLKSILKPPEPKLDFKIRLFKAACISILLYGCESWIFTEALIYKLDIFARTCYRIMLGIKQSKDHVTNKNLYQLTGQIPRDYQ